MAIIKPFKALRPKPELAKKVASKPYDVLNSQEAKMEAAGNDHSFLRITKAEIDLPEGIDVHSNVVYQKAKENLEKFITDGVLFKEAKDCYYVYELTMNGREQTGLVCVSSVDDYFNDVIKKHEFTRPEKEKDRIDHMLTIKAQTGNVFMACRDVDDLSKLINDWKELHQPAYDLTADDNVHHSVWVIDDEAAVK